MLEQHWRWFILDECSLHSCKTLKQLVTVNTDTRPLQNSETIGYSKHWYTASAKLQTITTTIKLNLHHTTQLMEKPVMHLVAQISLYAEQHEILELSS